MAHVRQSWQNLPKNRISWISLRIHQRLQPGHHLPAVYKTSYLYRQLASYCDLSKCNEKNKRNEGSPDRSDLPCSQRLHLWYATWGRRDVLRAENNRFEHRKSVNISVAFATIVLLYMHTFFRVKTRTNHVFHSEMYSRESEISTDKDTEAQVNFLCSLSKCITCTSLTWWIAPYI